MEKLRVLFPYVEAGFGHIMPMKAMVETFEKKYGDRVEVIPSNFYTETGNPHLVKFEQMYARQVRMYNRHPFVGWLATITGELFGTTLTTFGCMKLLTPISCREGIRHMKELKPDVVFSTHWATNYYAEQMKEDKPFTVMYCPDATLNKLFSYRADLTMISMPYGYLKALRKKQYTHRNMKLVPFLIRNEAFEVTKSKKELRKKLGIPEDNFTIVLAEGGYGLGKMGKMCELLVKEHLPLTVIPVCGKNEKLLKHFQSLTVSPEVTFRPYGFTEEILEFESAADLFCGKSGNIFAEATFYGNPSIVTNCSTLIEQHIADHYINTVGSTIKELNAKKAVRLIEDFAKDPSKLEHYREMARAYHTHYGAEKAADLLFREIKRRFPDRV